MSSIRALGILPQLLLLSASSPALATTTAANEDVRIVPSDDGRLGAWMVAGPFEPSHTDRLSDAPVGVDESRLDEQGKLQWQLAWSAQGPLDLASALHSTAANRIGYATGTLHLPQAGKVLILVGADDGVRVSVDGKIVLLRDEARPVRDDDNVIPMELAAGDHTLLLKVHQREGAWGFHVRVLDAATLAPPAAAYLSLQGTTAADARLLAGKMATFSFDRKGLIAGDAPTLRVRYVEGAPMRAPRDVTATCDRSADPAWVIGTIGANEGRPLPFEARVRRPGERSAGADGATESFTFTLSGRQVHYSVTPRDAVQQAVTKASAALDAIVVRHTVQVHPALQPGTIESITHLRDRLARLIRDGDDDVEALGREAEELSALTAALIREEDPYSVRTGVMRRAYRSPVDGELEEFGVYVPPSFNPARAYPLVVALHGWNGAPLSMQRWVFGYDDPDHDAQWEDRHPSPSIPDVDAIVITPDGNMNAMYRDIGEDDVMRVIDWAMQAYPIDKTRVTITGPSMGGIGSASIAFHHPSLFAASEPLCGYHDYFVRRDIKGRPIRPWEQALAKELSNVEWAMNGRDLPLYVVHGTLDRPIENSGHLIEAYERFGYSVRHEHPALGHNVWQITYQDQAGLRWLLSQRRNPHPREIHFRTARTRFGDDAWVHVRALSSSSAFGEVHAQVRSDHEIAVTTTNVAELHLDRDRFLVGPGAITVHIDGSAIEFAGGTSLDLTHEANGWRTVDSAPMGVRKHGNLAGPIRDIFHEPVLFVYGASDPGMTRANEEVARAWARVRPGVRANFPVMSDAEFLSRGEPLANDRALFLVGNARSNQVIGKLDPELPFHVDGDAVVTGSGSAQKRFAGDEVGVAFIRPNPARSDRYVAVVESSTAEGIWRSLSLPDLLPDFIVYDESVAKARGQVLLGIGRVRAGGFFDRNWATPDAMDDSPSSTSWRGPQTEYEATPYLP